MAQPVGRIVQLRLYPIRPLWALGSGWAAVGGSLAVSGLALSPEILVKLLLAWLLADPILGAIWDLGAGHTSPPESRGIWRRLLSPRLPDAASPWHLLPYTQVGSPGYRLACHLGRLRRWWQVSLWPEAGREFATVVIATGLAMLLGGILERNVLVLVLVSLVLSWLTVISERSQEGQAPALGDTSDEGMLRFWHALGEFGIPWLIGAEVMGGASRMVILLGICYTITYFGLINYMRDFRLISASQVTTALLLAGLKHPLAAGATAILLMPQWGLHIWANCVREQTMLVHPDTRSEADWAARGTYLRYIQPFVVLSLLMAALAIAP